MLLCRLIPKKSTHLRFLLLSSSSSLSSSKPPQLEPQQQQQQQHSSANYSLLLLRSFSTNSNGNGDGNIPSSSGEIWRLDNDNKLDSFFSHPDSPGKNKEEEEAGDVAGAEYDWLEKWNLDDDEERRQKERELFGITDNMAPGGDVIGGDGVVVVDHALLHQENTHLSAILKGPNRAFGDLIAASGITNAMLDSLFALKDFNGIDGLPPLREIEDMRYHKNMSKSARFEVERQKQEEIAKARVKQLDDKGRAYGTGRRKCSVARVWIQPGEGKFVVNDKQFDVYFPMLDHRAALLQPFSETKTLGLWDINCTVKGGGVSGQVGAIQLGISRALQNWEPDLRPPLRNAGLLTRDARVVERKKPGKAKARKSFQWVKR